MSGVTLHWAAKYLGKPWRSGARGPDAYYCWGLVQALCAERLAMQMPEVAVGGVQEQFGAILEASRGQGWRLVEGSPLPDDILLMRNKAGNRHCGYMVEADGRLGVLHADGTQKPNGPVGEVVFCTLAEATANGYGAFEFWRRA